MATKNSKTKKAREQHFDESFTRISPHETKKRWGKMDQNFTTRFKTILTKGYLASNPPIRQTNAPKVLCVVLVERGVLGLGQGRLTVTDDALAEKVCPEGRWTGRLSVHSSLLPVRTLRGRWWRFSCLFFLAGEARRPALLELVVVVFRRGRGWVLVVVLTSAVVLTRYACG